jgi:hypothetical protein
MNAADEHKAGVRRLVRASLFALHQPIEKTRLNTSNASQT